MIITVHFEDEGQDFFQWDIDENKLVVACRPCQSWLWVGCKITNKVIKVGGYLHFKSDKLKAKGGPNTSLVLKYKITSITGGAA